jgi:hypothetical protein
VACAVAVAVAGRSVAVGVAGRAVARAVGLEAVKTSRRPETLPPPIYSVAVRLAAKTTTLNPINTARPRRLSRWERVDAAVTAPAIAAVAVSGRVWSPAAAKGS